MSTKKIVDLTHRGIRLIFQTEINGFGDDSK